MKYRLILLALFILLWLITSCGSYRRTQSGINHKSQVKRVKEVQKIEYLNGKKMNVTELDLSK